jgi:hypothetical protein
MRRRSAGEIQLLAVDSFVIGRLQVFAAAAAAGERTGAGRFSREKFHSDRAARSPRGGEA